MPQSFTDMQTALVHIVANNLLEGLLLCILTQLNRR